MKSFKKIALAMVAAMTLGTISVAPASAAAMTLAVTLNGADKSSATSAAAAVALPVPADNTIGALEALKFVATVDTGTSVSVTATNATIVTALHDAAAPVTASSGSSSLTIATGTGINATFYVYTKTTAVGTVVVSNQGTTFTYYVQGTAGGIHTLAASAPSSAPAGTVQDILVTATDVFGNKVAGKVIAGRVFAAQGTLAAPGTATTGSTLADFGVAKFNLTLPTTGRALVEFSLNNAADGATAVVGLPALSLTPAVEIVTRDLAAELKAAQDALAAEKAASAKALTDAKAAADAAALKAAADLVTANAEVAKLKAEAVTAKAAADKALADATAAHAATLAKVNADNAAAMAAIKKAFNSLAVKWNKKNPSAKVALIK